MGSIGAIDWLIWLVYLVFITTVLAVYSFSKKEAHYSYFLKGFGVKILGGLAFALVYIYYYGFGDTFLYHRGATILSQMLIDSPLDYAKLIWTEGGNLPAELQHLTTGISYSRTYEEWYMVKLLSVVNLVSFQSYLVSTLFMSTLSFFGGWKLFLVFRDMLPKCEKYAFWAVFLVPSVIFWGGGIMKDSVTLFAINYLIYLLYFSLFKFSISKLSIALFLIYLIISLKAYIVLAFLPGLFLALYALFNKSIQNVLVKYVMAPFIIIGLIVASFYGLSILSKSSSKYQTENIEYQVKGFHSWHTDLGGSAYSLGDIEYTPTGVISKIPAALNVTYFRPYLWEARNPVVAIGAVESSFLLFVFLALLYKLKFKFVSQLKDQPLLYGMLLYCLIFGFAVGFTSYNFGALARYKIPVMSLFVFILLYLRWKVKLKEQTDKTELSDLPSGQAKNSPSIGHEQQ